MTITVMQPYFFPYIGYFSLIQKSDLFVVCDEVQNIRHGWINRNRILSNDKDFLYIRTQIIKNSQNKRIKELHIADDEEWKSCLLKNLNIYRKKGPYYADAIKVVEECLAYEERNLAKWNMHSLKCICDYIGIDHKLVLLSELDISYDNICESDEWALNITSAIGGNVYLNPFGGISFYDNDKYKSKGIRLEFLHHNLTEYNQFNHIFIPGLSIIDVMMFNSKDEIRVMIDDYRIIRGEDIDIDKKC